MADILPPRIEPLSDPGFGAHDQPAPKPRAKSVAAKKPALTPAPDIGAPEEEDKHELDEMA